MSVRSSGQVQVIEISGKSVGGSVIEGVARAWRLQEGSTAQMVELALEEGFFHPLHSHPEHESVGYLIRGRLEMGIGDQEFLLTAGDSWLHPRGVPHWTRALEPTRALEIHCPPRTEYR